jgi:hypothetical protein
VAVALLLAPTGLLEKAAGQQAVTPPHVTKESTAAFEAGLKYLAGTQAADGSWTAGGPQGGYKVPMTSLAGLSLLAHGDTPFRGPFGANVRKAVDFILATADERLKDRPNAREVLLGARGEESRSMHGHGFAMLFLAEVYGMCDDTTYQERIRKILEKAIVLTVRSQSPKGGWMYGPDTQLDEGSVTVTQVQGLRACRNAGIDVPKTTIDRAIQYIEKSAQSDGGIAYGVNQHGSRPALTAAAVAVLYNAGQYESSHAEKALAYAVQNVKVDPAAGNGDLSGHYHYAHLYMSQALYTAGGRDPKLWDDYFPKIRDRLIAAQDKTNGSWGGDWVGPVYGTAIGCLILQLPHNTLPIMQR